MRIVPDALQEKLDSGVTTLCLCWRVERQDGTVLGFTDHDDDVTIDDLICRAHSGLNASEATSRLGLTVAGSEIAGALDDETLNEADLAAGRYDAAIVKVYLVDWSEPDLRILMSKGTLGEVRREGHAFAAEVRGLANRLNQESGRLYTPRCSADLGDARCKVDLEDTSYRATATVSAVRGVSQILTTGLDGYDEGWFTAGRLTWLTGANSGVSVEIKRHRTIGDGVALELWQAMPEPIQEGDTATVTAGCDKSFATCVLKFGNALNYRGFPHIPGNDFITRYARPGEPGHTGASLQR